MKKNTVYLFGGFGNNLFQISLALQLRSMGQSVELNTFFCRRNILTKFLNWSIHGHTTTSKIVELLKFEEKSKITAWQALLLAIVFLKKRWKKTSLDSFGKFATPKSIHHFGYWQFGEHINTRTNDELRFALVKILPNSKHLREALKHSCIVHVRLGDFDASRTLQADYFVRAIGRCVKEFQPKDFLIVSEDPEKAKHFLSDVGCNFSIPSKNNSMLEDFSILYFGAHLVSSNSTFCYWAAKLGSAKCVYVPSHIDADTSNPWPMDHDRFKRVHSFHHSQEVN